MDYILAILFILLGVSIVEFILFMKIVKLELEIKLLKIKKGE